MIIFNKGLWYRKGLSW